MKGTHLLRVLTRKESLILVIGTTAYLLLIEIFLTAFSIQTAP